MLGDPRAALTVPAELDTRSLTAQLYDLPLRDPVPLGLGLLAGALARCVLPVVAGEILLRGFALPALTGWKGLAARRALIVSVLFGGLTSLAGQPGLAALSMLLGVAAVRALRRDGLAAAGVAWPRPPRRSRFGAACALAPAAIAGLAVGCTAWRWRSPRSRRRAAGAAPRGRSCAAARREARRSRRLLVLALAGCGGGDGPLELVSTEPPAGAEADGQARGAPGQHRHRRG